MRQHECCGYVSREAFHATAPTFVADGLRRRQHTMWLGDHGDAGELAYVGFRAPTALEHHAAGSGAASLVLQDAPPLRRRRAEMLRLSRSTVETTR